MFNGKYKIQKESVTFINFQYEYSKVLKDD